AGGLIDSANSTLVAKSNTDSPLVATKKIGDHYVVELGFLPMSNDTMPAGWSGDGARLMANALLYSVGQAPPPNTAPVAVADTASTDEDTPVTIDVLANDNDGDGDALVVTNLVAGTGTESVIIDANGKVIFTPA